MKNLFKNIVKAGVLFAVVGVILAVAAPYIGVFTGLVPTVAAAATAVGHSANPLWLGAFFGAFGALDAALRPAIGRLFGDKNSEATVSQTTATDPTIITIDLSPAQEEKLSGALSHFQNRLEKETKAAKDCGCSRGA